jgi:hypothetical protein
MVRRVVPPDNRTVTTLPGGAPGAPVSAATLAADDAACLLWRCCREDPDTFGHSRDHLPSFCLTRHVGSALDPEATNSDPRVNDSKHRELAL